VVPALEKAIEHQRRAFEGAPHIMQFRRFLSNNYQNLALFQRKQGRPAESAAAIKERQKPWPDCPRELYLVSREFAANIPLVGVNKDKLTEAEEAERRRYGDWAMEALRQAAAKGFHNVSDLKKYPQMAPLRDREDFQKLVRELEERQKSS
jgi:hypothetical protein